MREMALTKPKLKQRGTTMKNGNYTNELYEMAVRWRCQILRGNIAQETIKPISEFVKEFSVNAEDYALMLTVYRGI